MANDLNNVCLSGRLTRDIEIKTTNSENLVGNFTIAVGGWNDKVLFMNCKRFDKNLTKIEQYLTKGTMVIVSGRLDEEKWKGKDGTEKSRVVLNVSSITFCGGKKEEREEDGNDEDVPF